MENLTAVAVVDVKPKFKVYNEFELGRQIRKAFDIEIPGGKTISVDKWSIYDDYEHETDWEFTEDAGKKLFDAMTEDEQEEFTDFVLGLNLNESNI